MPPDCAGIQEAFFCGIKRKGSNEEETDVVVGLFQSVVVASSCALFKEVTDDVLNCSSFYQ